LTIEQDFIVEGFSAPPRPKGITLRGKTVRLEPLNPELHARGLYDADATDPDGRDWDYLPYGPFGDFAAYKSWLEIEAAKDDPTFFAIVRLSDSRPVGVASFLRINPDDGSIEVGHINFSRLLQRTVEATEAMYLMMKWAFESGYRRYEWKCHALNTRSRVAAQRLGLSFEGVFRQMSISKGRNRNTAWFAAIDTEWLGLRACFDRYLAAATSEVDHAPRISLSALTKPLLHKTDTMDLG